MDTPEMYEQDSEDEKEILRSRVKILKHVALEISDEIKSQNIKIKNLQPGFSESLSNIMNNIRQIGKLNPNQFRTFFFYVGGSLFLGFVFFLLFILT